ncbi:MAG: YolD-like family protein [Bacillota bacterium]
MLRDRGKMKWAGFFMPEHVKMLYDVESDYHKTPRPQLDEGQIEDIERLLSESLEDNVLLEITTWKNGFFSSRIAIVKKIDLYEKTIIIQDELDVEIKLRFFDIVNAELK